MQIHALLQNDFKVTFISLPDMHATTRRVGERKCFQELRYKPGLDYKYRLMESFIMLASSNRGTVQQALSNFLEMAGGENSVTVV